MIRPEAIAAQGSAWIKKAAAEICMSMSLKLPTNIKPSNPKIGDSEKQKKPAPTRRPEISRASAKRPKQASAESVTCDNPCSAGRM